MRVTGPVALTLIPVHPGGLATEALPQSAILWLGMVQPALWQVRVTPGTSRARSHRLMAGTARRGYIPHLYQDLPLGSCEGSFGREEEPRWVACIGPARGAAAPKSFSVLRDSRTSGPVADMGRCEGLDLRDCVKESALSRDCFYIGIG